MKKYKIMKMLSASLLLALVFTSSTYLTANAENINSSISKDYSELNEEIETKDLDTQLITTEYESNNIITESEKSLDDYIPEGMATDTSDKRVQRIVIGDDGRSRVNNTTSFPFSAICYINTTYPDGAVGSGTAWMAADNVAVTAGHCLYNKDHGGWAKKVIVVPGMNDSKVPYGFTAAAGISAPSTWTKDNSSDHDWGVIKLKDDLGKKTGYFGMYWSLLSLKGDNVEVTGYPADKTKYTMWKMNGNIKDSTSNRLYYDMDTYAGQSGCPVYWHDNKGYRAVGIHIIGNKNTNSNSATRITKTIVDYVDQYRK